MKEKLKRKIQWREKCGKMWPVKLVSVGSGFTGQIFTGELSGVDSTGAVKSKVLILHRNLHNRKGTLYSESPNIFNTTNL